MTVNSSSQPDETWTVRRILDWTRTHLEERGSDTPRLDAEILLAHARNCNRINLYADYDVPLTDRERAAMRELVTRRARHEPVAYLVGFREFFSLDFRVTSDVLIPRPDTETLVVEAIDRAKELNRPRILDLCTGSGCIAISIATQVPKAEIVATDTSSAALAVASENARTHKVDDRIAFYQGNLFDAIPAGQSFDLIVSNPPYIPTAEIETLQEDVRLHEPHIALDGGPDGLAFINRIVAEAPQYLKPGGRILIELDSEQAATVAALFDRHPQFTETSILKDLAGLQRVVGACRTDG